ncbi:MAG: C39 family peptidase [Nanoarchaeota archaeon]
MVKEKKVLRKILKVPYDKQKTDYTCGPASLKMILEFFGIKKPEIILAHQAHTKKKTGTTHEQMINLVRREGLYCYVHNQSNINTIKHFITAGLPVIISFKNPEDKEGHYAVAIGYNKGIIILNDPWNGKNFKIDDKVLKKFWVSENKGKKSIIVISKKPIIRGKQYNPL